MAFETSFRPATKAVGTSSMPNLPAMFICLMLFLQTYLALANPAANAAASALFPGYKTTSSPAPLSRNDNSGSDDYMFKIKNNDNNANEDNFLVPRQQQQSIGSTCDGSEGQWNCMSTSWQRCAAGRWSVVVKAADGTKCRPTGLTWDLAIEYEKGQGGGDGSGRATSSALAGSGWGSRGAGEGWYPLGGWSVVLFGGLGLIVGGWV